MKINIAVVLHPSGEYIAQSALGMLGLEMALEALMCHVFGNLLEEGVVTKIADDLYCRRNTPKDIQNWQKVPQAIDKCDLCLSALKTVINPQTTTNLGWVWKSGTSQASSHHFATLTSCPERDTIGQLNFLFGALKMLTCIISCTCRPYIQGSNQLYGQPPYCIP